MTESRPKEGDRPGGGEGRPKAVRDPAVPRAVTWDLWHTLIYLDPEDEERYVRTAAEVRAHVVRQWPRRPGIREEFSPEEAGQRAFLRAADAERRGVGMSLASQAQEAARLAGRWARPEEYIRALSRFVRDAPLRESPGARACLARLHSQGFRIGVVSNLSGEPGEGIRRVVSDLGLAPWIEAWSLSEELPWAKPSPEIFLHCLRELGVPPERAIHVGDHPYDILGARKAGFREAILYRGAKRYGAGYERLYRPNEPIDPPPRHVVEDLGRIPSIAEELLP